MANTIKISDRMAEAILGTKNTAEGNRLELATRAGTVAALMDRGLVQLDLVRSRRDGYHVHTLTEHGMWVRRILGNIPLQRSFDMDGLDEKMVAILAGETRNRTQETDMAVIKISDLMADAPTVTPEPSGNATVREVSKTLKAAGFTPYDPDRGGSGSGYQASQLGPRVSIRWRQGADTDLMGDSRWEATRNALKDAYGAVLEAAGYPVVDRSSGLYVVGPKTPEAATMPASVPHLPAATQTGPVCGEAETNTGWYYECTLTGPHNTHEAQGTDGETLYSWSRQVTEYSVKIWYRSGAYEGASHCPEDLARKIFAEAVESDGVEFAELHGPSGKLVESKSPAE